MKIHIVTIAGTDTPRLVRSHTRAGAEKFVRDSIKPAVNASVPTQQELVDALKSGVTIEDATAPRQASIPEPSQVDGHADAAALIDAAKTGDTPFGDEYLAGIAAQADAFDPYATAPAAVTP